MNTSGAVWVSHSSMSDYVKCPKAYYYRNIYKNPKTRHKIAIINPALALGQSVHEVLESLSTYPAEQRMKRPLFEEYDTVWKKVTGKLGGFHSQSEEEGYKQRGRQMIQRVIDHPGPLIQKAIKLKSDDDLPPRFWLLEKEKILLCGKIDWMEYLPVDDSVHIIDFKTGKHAEDPSSMQLAIYCLLVNNCQKRKINKVSYWYLESDNDPIEKPMPDITSAREQIETLARTIKKARIDQEFICPRGECFSCRPFLAVINGDAEMVGESGYQDIYIIR